MFIFWWWWLVVSCGITIAFSLGMVLAPELLHQFFNQVLFASSQLPTDFDTAANDYIFLVYGILGAVMIGGWMIPIIFILVGAFRHKQRWSWLAIASSIGIWFAIDSAISVMSGFWQNAVFNVVFLLMFMIPLVATYGDFNSGEHKNAKGLEQEA
ncbi:hypothetical protein Pse7367_1639 [Thalassoporum mexicanum PCC 7367]|uniref:hypothetical protein n=1 Tax=Thalassoporum mexicanum TaxID=3457544 RepID=UPI00029FB273|nr:hypothetical protein [Pseudanabaena sp. PCC 7367]AFY69927.1 hypothetical protein Pse7367_1639 [Pseudanabaena sp. PCC 7367]